MPTAVQKGGGADANIYGLFAEVAQRAQSRPFLIQQGETKLRYADLDRAVGEMAARLAELGVVSGDRVLVQVEKSTTAVLLYLAVLRSGAVFVPLNTAYTPAEVAYFLGDTEPRVLVCDQRKLAGLRSVADKAGVAAVRTLNADGSGTLVNDPASRPWVPPVARAPDDLACIVYTSGTTGRSKGAMLTHRNLAANAQTLVDAWAFSTNDVLLHALPIYHVHGLFVGLHCALLSGATLLFHPAFDAAAVARDLPGATVFMGVPTYYVRLLEVPGFDRQTAAPVRLFISGSAPLLEETFNRFATLTGHRILERYGMTETGMMTSNPYAGERVAGTVGFALPEVEVRVAAPDGALLPPGTPGVLEVRGPNVFKGYWQLPERTAEEMRPDGFFITGDVATMTADGRVRIVGRAKDLIISGGLNIYPKEIELLIDEIDGVKESAVIGVPHPDFGEAVVAVVVTPADSVAIEAQVMTHLKERLARFKQPKRVFAVSELPRNAMGKVQKARLREEYRMLFEAG